MENSNIEWTDHTFNPWWGCVKISPGCKHCYAETLDKRWDGGHWGPGSSRRIMSDSYWKQPVKWNREVELGMTKKNKVFCASMADVFEDHLQIVESRNRLFKLIEQTPYLIWQLLTKRPENIMNMVPDHWKKEFPKNVWIGCTVENQSMANERIPHLLNVPAKIRFLSCEPLLTSIDLENIPDGNSGQTFSCLTGEYNWEDSSVLPPIPYLRKIDWVICGGESGHDARPMHPIWAKTIRDQCKDAGVAFFFKQWGEWQEGSNVIDHNYKGLHICMLFNGNYCDYLNVEKYKSFTQENFSNWKEANVMAKTGKKQSGSLLDGVEHKNFPE